MSSTPEIRPATDFEAVTPSDSTNISNPARALYIGSDGDVTCVNGHGDAVTFALVVAGTILPVQTTRVNATGTTATDIVALF